MNPATIIHEAQSDGVRLALSPAGTLKASGEAAAVHRWLPILKAHKPDILAALHKAANEGTIPDDLERLIRRAGTFWEYSPEDYDLIHDLARRDPDGLRVALESDKWQAMSARGTFEERAAIMQYDAGLSCEDAERQALLLHRGETA